ncbi:ABC transporter ATP-binding protein/permease [Brucepastera parasyntrophica]|uniref:ABC transporter ATP-binding protein n=1 Tax=Brucepastera parasyntrophica TaxID=2880008 RepID=UPI00210A0610|nr:ABC transporter ATP-binding protein [Brucepastera parasyntrophica]ULQ58458.1 ABC transporter ATP-binding protein/permease [Brucepastera parasyntrophica]
MDTKKEPAGRTGFSRLMEIAGTKRGLLTLSGILSVVSTVLQFIPFVAVYFIVAELFRNAASPALIDYAVIRTWGLRAIISLAASLVFLYASNMASHISAFNILYELRVKLAEHLAKLPLGYHTRQSTGTIKKILEVSVEKIENFVAHQIPDLVGAVALPVILLAAMFSLDWRLALSCGVPILFAFFLQSFVFLGKKGRQIYSQYHDSLEQMNAAGIEYVRGMPAVKVFGLSVRSFLSFHNAIIEYKDLALMITKCYKKSYVVFFVMLSSLLTFILPVGLFILSGNPENQAFAFILLLFLVLAPGLSVPVLKLLYVGGNMRNISEGVERIDAIFSQPPVKEPAVPVTPEKYPVRFDSVSFSYAGNDEADRVEALSDVSFTAEEKAITALVGPSGSGKSTVANLIPRFWDVASGAIRIGGVDIRDMKTETLMDTVSFVFQDVHLFYDSIEENIRMGRASAGREDVIAAARAACCHEFIEQLPQGYRTKIGEGGTYLSGGEAQRISIARAILKNAPILVLDEATAYADPENETKIQEALGALIKDKTVIIIAHRLSTIKNAGRILVLNKGRIVERGTHEELLRKKELYSRMWAAHIDAGAWTLNQGEKDMEVTA